MVVDAVAARNGSMKTTVTLTKPLYYCGTFVGSRYDKLSIRTSKIPRQRPTTLETREHRPTLRSEPSGRTVEGRQARSTLQSRGRSLKARGSSRLILVDDGFFAGRSAPRVTRPLPMCTRDHDVHALRAWAFQNARDILFYVIMKAGKTSMRP